MRFVRRLAGPVVASLSVGVATATPAIAQTDHYTCYKARATSGSAKFEQVDGVTLVDRLRPSTVRVGKPRHLCLPTSKNGENPAAATNPEHLEDYRIRPMQRFEKLKNRQVHDQFGSVVVDLRKADTLMVPTAKDPNGPPDPLGAPAVDHFQCYKVKRSKGQPKFQLVPGVALEDQFGSIIVNVKKPRRLCHPVDKNGENPGAESHAQSLMCYQIKQADLPKFQKRTGLFTENQFGTERLDAKKPFELCVPAFALPLVPTPTPGSTAGMTATPMTTPTPVPTATAGPSCGNDTVDPGETCDGTDDLACPGACLPSCQCSACGDNAVNTPTEQCDGIDSLACPAQCRADCLCPVACDFLDSSVCMHPFPSDYLTLDDPTAVTGRRVSFQSTGMPRNAAQKPIDPADYNWSDGFSPGAMIITQVPGLDLAMTGAPPITDMAQSLDPNSPMVIVNADTLAHHLFWAELDALATSDATRNLMLRPGVNFEEHTRYIVALRNLKDASGTVIPPSADFVAYRDDIPTGDPVREHRRAHMESLFTTLAAAGVPRADLYLAWDFTVASAESTTGRLLFMRDDAFASLGAAAPTYVVTQVEDDVDAHVFRRVTGQLIVPRYVSAPVPPARFILDAVGLPIRQPTDQTTEFICNIPRSTLADAAATAVPGRPLLHGHGLFGDASTVNADNVVRMANEHNFPSCAVAWIGMATEDIPNTVTITADLSRFPELADRLQQSMLNFLFLGRLMIHPDGFLADPNFQDAGGNPVIDPSALFYDGNSQGGIAGGALMAVAQDFTRGVLGVPAMNYSTLLARSVDFDLFAIPLYQAYPNEIDRPLIFGLIQMLWDRGEPNGYAHHMTDDPLPNTPPHQVLLHPVIGDHQVTNIATEVEARTIGAHVYQPAVELPHRHLDVTPYLGIPAIPSFPFAGSAMVVWDTCIDDDPADGVITNNECITDPPPPTNEPNRDRSDPHSRPRNDACGRKQKAAFLSVGGGVIDVCAGAPCQANTTPFPCPN